MGFAGCKFYFIVVNVRRVVSNVRRVVPIVSRVVCTACCIECKSVEVCFEIVDGIISKRRTSKREQWEKWQTKLSFIELCWAYLSMN